MSSSANFWAWFWVIFFFSLGYRLFALRKDGISLWISPVVAYLTGLFGVLGTNAFIVFVIRSDFYRALVIATLLTLAVILVVALRPRFHLSSIPALTFWIPFITHIFVLMAGLKSGLILDPPYLLLVGLLMTLLAFYLHRATVRRIFQIFQN